MMALGVFQILLYIATIVALMALASSTFKFAKEVNLSPALTSSIVCITLVYLSALLPGALGFLSASNSYILFLLLVVGILFLIRAILSPHIELNRVPIEATHINFTRLDWLFTGLGVILCGPLLVFLKGVPMSFMNTNPILGWDIVSYHLPGVIEFYQAKSLWSVSGPYQSYSFGYELLGNYFSQNFHASWGLLLAHILSLWFVIAAVMAVSKAIYSSNQTAKINWLTTSIFAIGIWTISAIGSIGAIGKNDIFMGAAVFSALAFLLILGDKRQESKLRNYLLILFIGISLGLALGVKPSAIAFLPYFLIATSWVLFSHPKILRNALISVSIVLVTAVLIGGFWLSRNLILFGSLSPVMDSGWQSSIIANLLNQEMYRAVIHYPTLIFASAAWFPALLIARRYYRMGVESSNWWLMASFHLMACLVFVLTPFVFQGGGFEVRLGMPLLLVTSVIYSLVIQLIFQKFFSSQHFWWVSCISVLVLMMGIPYYWSSKSHSGLPGYEQVLNCSDPKNCPKTNVYSWVQSLNKPLRIYSAGLRPLGLYGHQWDNILFYDLHSSTLVANADAKKRIAAVVNQFDPNLILISIAPQSSSSVGAKPEVINWMKLRPDLFSEVYSDEIVSGFQLNRDAKAILAKEFPEPYNLKMGQ
jgi:hypothetical protein